MSRSDRFRCVIVAVSILYSTAGTAQSLAPVAPALTPAQIKASEALAAKYDRAAALEKERLETFKDRPLASVIQKAFNVYANELLVAAQMMPESSYGFRPTPDVRTFADQINHATSIQYVFCNQAGTPPGVERRTAPSLRGVTAKADVVKAFEESMAYCSRVLAAASEAWLMEKNPRRMGGPATQVEGIRAHAFMYNNVHDSETFGIITLYMRLQGLVPSSTALHEPTEP